MQRRDQAVIDLQERLSPGQDNETPTAYAAPHVFNGISQSLWSVKATAAFAVHPDKVCVAKIACRGRTIASAIPPSRIVRSDWRRGQRQAPRGWAIAHGEGR